MPAGFLSLRPGLRAKILLITALAPAVLAAAVLLTVHRNVRAHVDSTSIHENLEHSATVFESMLAVRLKALAGGAEVIARDPRFFSLVMLGPAQRDARFIATMKGTADDFNRITETDVFEVYDRQGRLLASVGPKSTLRAARAPILNEVLAGHPVSRIMPEGTAHFQVAAVPVRGDGRIVGALLLGAEIGKPLAEELKTQMLSEVTFLSNGRVTGTTLTDTRDLEALDGRVAVTGQDPEQLRSGGVLKVRSGHATYLTLIRRIPGGDAGQLYVMQRSNDPESVFLRRMQSDMLQLGGLAVVIALVVGWLFSRQITRPVLALVEGARAMEAGEFDTEIEVRNRDELGYLAERFRVMRERERSYVKSLQEAARVKSEFISIASHELRTPISVIQGYREMLTDGSLGSVTARQVRALNAIRDCLAQLTKVAEDATQVAQIEGERVTLEPREAPVAPIAERAVALAVTGLGERRVRVATDLAGDLGSAWIDEARLTDALVHLLTNGIRFTPDGGEVVLSGRGDADHVMLEVRDTGIGISAERIDQLFGRSLLARESKNHHSSSSLEFKSEGLGFGLAIARAVVEAHGGTIDARSKEGEGTVIALRLNRISVDALDRAA